MLNLVGSIDGENLAFGIARAGTEIRLDAVSHYKTSEFPTFTDAVQNYTREQNLRTSELQVGLAVAGVARGDIITQANCRWFISVSGLKAWLGCDPLIINDFSAIAWALSALPASRMKTAGPFPPKAVAPGGTYLVVGSGPGLGVATIVADKSGFITVLGSEGGHTSFSPQSAREDALLLALRKKHQHVSFERLLAAAGLQSIYSWLVERDGEVVPSGFQPVDVVSMARSDRRAVEAVDIFSEILGSFVGNSVLAAGAFDGVFLVSPLLGSMLPTLQSPRFRAAFTGKGRMKKMLDPVPISFVPEEEARLYGLATALLARQAAQMPLAA